MTVAVPDTPVEPALHDAARRLLETLVDEQSALVARDADALSTLCVHRRRQVSALERALAPPRAPDTPTAPETVELLRSCRELNAANAAGVAVRLASVRRALGQLARLAGVDKAWGYTADGAPARPLQGRSLGEG